MVRARFTSRNLEFRLTPGRTISPEGPTVPLSILAFSLSQVILGHDLDIDKVAQCAAAFPTRYAGRWSTTTWTNWCCVGDKMLHVQFHVRYLSTVRNATIDPRPKYPGLYLKRDWGKAVELGANSNFFIVETRSSIAILTSLRHQLPYYSMVTLTDNPDFSLDCIENQNNWTAMGLKPCGESTGVVIFQLAVSRLITEWGNQWNATLNRITSMSPVEVSKFFWSTMLIEVTTNTIIRSTTFSTQ